MSRKPMARRRVTDGSNRSDGGPAAPPMLEPVRCTPPPRYVEEDGLLSALHLAGAGYVRQRAPGGPPALGAAPAQAEIAAGPVLGAGDLEALVGLLRHIDSTLRAHPGLAALVRGAPAAFGSGEMVASLFATLYGPRSRRKPRPEDPQLTDREVQVLYWALRGVPNAAIGERMGISERTVTTHLNHIYQRLDAHSMLEAVVRAEWYGYLGEGGTRMVLEAFRHHGGPDGPLREFCLHGARAEPPLEADEIPAFADLAIVLLALGAVAGRQQRGDGPARLGERGGVCVVGAEGGVRGPFSVAGMGIGRHVVVAPPHAARQGFTPGNVFVVHDLLPQQGLCRGALSEFTPAGEYVRTFRGGDDIATRLVGPVVPAFGADGSLLVTSGWLTRGILAFRENGATVRRFADGLFYGMAADGAGRVYASYAEDNDGRIAVFDTQGQPLYSFGQRKTACLLFGVAAGGAEQVLALRWRDGSRFVDVYGAADGALRRTFKAPPGSGDHLASGPPGHALVPCPTAGAVCVMSAAGALCGRVELGGMLQPWGAALSEAGDLWVCGAVE